MSDDAVKVVVNDAFDPRKVSVWRKDYSRRFKPAPVEIDPRLLKALVAVVAAAKDVHMDSRCSDSRIALAFAIQDLETL